MPLSPLHLRSEATKIKIPRGPFYTPMHPDLPPGIFYLTAPVNDIFQCPCLTIVCFWQGF